MFSATFNEHIQKMARVFLKNGYFFISVGLLNSAVNTVEQYFIKVS